MNGVSVSYTYDSLDRLSAVVDNRNRTQETSSITGLPSVSLAFNADDLLTSGESYDANGNTTATGGRTFTYDSENHLIGANGTVSIVYDGDGNRVAKTVGGATILYLVDDLNATGYPQVIEELVGGSVARTYTYGLQRISEEQMIGSTWTPSFYGYDGGGSVRQLTSSAGSVTDTYDYDAFGNKINSTGSTPNNYLYRGEHYDSDLGLYYLRARYYNPLTGRFLSRDPESGRTPIPATLHKYLYVGADPVNRIDPRGRAIIEYADIDTRPFGKAPFLNALSCVVGIGTAAASLELDPYGLAFTVYGCVAPVWSPDGAALKFLKSGLDLASCTYSAYVASKDVISYARSPSPAKEYQTGVDLLGNLVGCGVSGILASFGE